MAENTRARSAERAHLSAAGPSGTTASRERATIDLTSQFNFFFEELRSAVKRPDSLTVGADGPVTSRTEVLPAPRRMYLPALRRKGTERKKEVF